MEATSPNKIYLSILKKLSLNLAKLFNHCLMEKFSPSQLKLSTVRPVLKNTGEHSLFQCCSISCFSVISKIFGYIINKEVVDHLSRNNLLSNGLYRFHCSRSSADVLTVATHRISETLNDRFILGLA